MSQPDDPGSTGIHLCLSDLLDQDLSSYEYFQGLPSSMQAKLFHSDVRSFDQMQAFVADHGNQEALF